MDQYYDDTVADDLINNDDFSHLLTSRVTRNLPVIINKLKNYLPNLIGGVRFIPSTKTI